MPINVSILGETGVSVSVSGNTGVSVVASGGIGPAGFLTVPGTATNAFGTFQLVPGPGISVSTTSGQFTIASYDTAAVAGFAPVQSVAGRVGAVVLQAADVTAGTFAIARIPTISYTALSNVPTTFAPSAHTHSTAEIASFSVAAAAASPVQSVQGRSGNVTISRADLTAAAAVHTHSTADVVGLTSSFTPSVHTHSTADIVAFTAAASASAPVQSVAGRTGAISLSAVDISGLANVATSGSYTSLSNVPLTFAPATHTHAASDIASGTLDHARLPTISYTALSNVPASFVPVTHTHAAGDIQSGTLDFARLPSISYTSLANVPVSFVPSTHTHDAAEITAGTISAARLPAYVASVNGITGTPSIVAGANVTVSTSGSSITILAESGASVPGPQGPPGSFGDPQTISKKTASYTLQLADVGTLLTFSAATGTISVNVPPSSSVAWVAGSHVDVARLGLATVQISGGGGVSVISAPSTILRDVGSGGSLVYLGSDEWLLVGDLA